MDRDPDEAAYTGYDVTRMLLAQVDQVTPQVSLSDALRQAEPFLGLASRFQFKNSNINQAIHFMEYRGGEAILVD